MAGNRAPGAYVRSDVASNSHWLGLTLAVNLMGTAQRSLMALSDGSAEVVSLLVVGFSLIGVSRALKRQRQQPAASVQRSHEARPAADVTSLAAHSLARKRQESRGRAAG